MIEPRIKKNFVQFESVWIEGEGATFSAREDEPALTCAATPALELQRAEASRTLRESLERLSDREKETVIRHHELGESYAQIGNAYGLSKQRAYQLDVRALKKLRAILHKVKP